MTFRRSALVVVAALATACLSGGFEARASAPPAPATGYSWLTEDQMVAPHARLAQQAEASAAAVDAALSLHSRAGSTKKIYLDFDGFTVVSGTAWASNGISTGAKSGFSIDGDPSTFTQAELDYIATVWRIVAEKYSPFDVDVTTAFQSDDALTRTTSGDTAYGTHVVFTDDQNARTSGCTPAGCAGIAWIDVFNNVETLNKYEPAWVYTTLNFGSGDFQQTAGQAANSAAHEVGHTLALHHDATGSQPTGYYGGQGVWSPIMGSSNRAVQQFNNLGYPDAATPGQVDPTDGVTLDPDDFDVITKAGLAYRPALEDEGGALDAPATTGQVVSADGVITTDADTDTFTVDRSACTGALTVAATGIGMGQTLDLKLTVGGPSDTLVDDPVTGFTAGTPNTPTGMNASLSVPTASAGTMTVTVEGVGDATSGYSGYGSVGQYHLAISGCVPGAAVVPDPPTGLAAAQITKTRTASLSWTAPASHGSSALTGYRITGVPGAPITLSNPNATSTTLTGLTPGSSYTVGVTALNSVGPSTTATTGLTVHTYVPTSPPSVTATVHGTSVDVSWTAAANPGLATLQSWDVRYFRNGVENYLEPQLPAGTTSWSRSGLSAGSWSVRVEPAYTADDTTNPQYGSDTFTVTTIPSAPKIGTASSGTSGGAVNAIARWAAPTSTGGSAITGYRVIAYKSTISGSVISATISKLLSPSARSYTFGLPAARYKFRVVAYNAVGRSPYSAFSGLVYAR